MNAQNFGMALGAVVIATVLWFIVKAHFGIIPKLAAIGILGVTAFVCFWTFFPETTRLVFGISHNVGEYTDNLLALLKENTEARDRVVYKIKKGTAATITAAVSYKNNIREDGQLWHTQLQSEELKPQEVITAFTRTEWARRHDTDVDGVPCIPVQLHVANDKMGRFEIHNPLIYLVPREALVKVGGQEPEKTQPEPKTPLKPAPPAAKPAAAPPATATKNIVTQGSTMGRDQQAHPVWTVSLSGEDQSELEVTQVPAGHTFQVSQLPGTNAGFPAGVEVKLNGQTVPFQECHFRQYCGTWSTSVENSTGMAQTITVKNTGGSIVLVANDMDMYMVR